VTTCVFCCVHVEDTGHRRLHLIYGLNSLASLGHIHIIQIPGLIALHNSVKGFLINLSLRKSKSATSMRRRHNTIVVN
jgi:hypothetical protein